MMTDIKKTLKEYASKFNSELPTLFNFPKGKESRVVEAMYYSLTNGGKRLRAFLVYETSKLFGLDFEQSFRVSAALEMIHAYSLIHDDLPAMDNDDLRRGKPTCHIQFDEATAIIAGDGLQAFAFEIISDIKTSPSPEIRCKLINHLAKAAGAFDGMVAGQMLDLYAETCDQSEKNEDLIQRIEVMKTGRLIKYACEAGAILGNASKEEYDALMIYAQAIGKAFQITDDILDAIGDEKVVGKNLHKDQNRGKVTFITLYGLEKAKEISKNLIEQAKDSLKIFGDKAKNFELLADYILNRDH